MVREPPDSADACLSSLEGQVKKARNHDVGTGHAKRARSRHAIDAPDDETMTALGLIAGKAGNVRTQTLRAFSAADMKAILAKVA